MYIMRWDNRVFTALLGDGTWSMSQNISVLNYPTKEIDPRSVQRVLLPQASCSEYDFANAEGQGP